MTKTERCMVPPAGSTFRRSGHRLNEALAGVYLSSGCRPNGQQLSRSVG
jgi:hypothetical protein